MHVSRTLATLAIVFGLFASLAVPVAAQDLTPPTVDLQSPADGAWFAATSVTISGNATDPPADSYGLNRVEVSCDGGTLWNAAALTYTTGNNTGDWTYNCLGLLEGANVVHARAFDNVSLESVHDIITVNVDLTAPTVDLTSHTDGQWVTAAAITVLGTAADGGSGVSFVHVSCDNGGSWNLAAGTTAWTYASCALSPGANVLHARAFDAVGRESVHDIVTVNYDPDPPTVAISSHTDGQWVSTSSPLLSGTAAETGGSGLLRVEVSCDNGATWNVVAGLSLWTFGGCFLAPGANIVHARSFDVAGWESVHDIITLNYDPTAPTVAVTSHTDGQWISTPSPALAGTAADGGGSGLDRVEVSCDDGGTWNVATGTSAWSYGGCILVAGANTIHVRSFDAAGWESAHAIVTLNVDLSPPSVAITSPNDGSWSLASTVSVAGTADDGESGLDRVEVSCDGGVSWTVALGTSTWTRDCTGLAEGAAVIHARAWNVAGAESVHDIITVNVDLVPPTVSITSPPDGIWTNTNTQAIDGTAADTASGLGRVEVSCDNAATWTVAVGTSTWSHMCVGLSEGPNAIHARSFDVVGRESAHAITTVNVDTVPPFIDLSSPAAGAILTTSPVNVIGTAADGGSGVSFVHVSCDDGATWNLAAGTLSWSFACSLAVGANTLHARAFDNVGWESAHDIVTVTYDPDAPTVAIILPADGVWIRTTTQTINGTAADIGGSGVDRVEVSCDNGVTWNLAMGTSTWFYDCVGLSEGAHTIHARAFDGGGSESPNAIITINVDLTAPVVAITSPPNGAWINATTMVIDGTASDGGSGLDRVEVSCDNAASWSVAAGTTTWNFACTSLVEGANTIHARAFDLAGAESGHAVITVNVDTTPPSVAITSPVDGALFNTFPVAIDGTAADGGSGLDWVEVSCDNGATWNIAVGTTAWTRACALVAGPNIIHARSFDMVGWESTHAIITITYDSTPPALVAATLSASTVNWSTAATVDLFAEYSEVGTGGLLLTAAEWNFSATTPTIPDGTGVAMAAVDGTFDSPAENATAAVNVAGWAPGAYTFWVHARDAAGNWAAWASVALTIVDDEGPEVVGTPTIDPPSPVPLSTGGVFLTANVSDAAHGGFVVTAVAWCLTDLGQPPSAGCVRQGVLDPLGADVYGRSVSVSGLTAGSYNLWVQGTDGAGNAGPWGSQPVVLTIVLTDDLAPLLTGPSLDIVSADATVFEVTLTLTASDVLRGNGTIGALEWYLSNATAPSVADGGGNPFTLAECGPAGVTVTCDHVLNISSGVRGGYQLWAHARDAGNWAPWASVVLTITSRPPAAPGNVRVTATGSSYAVLAWDASPTAITYEVWINQTGACPTATFRKVTTVPLLTANITGLAASTTYCFRVYASDGTEVTASAAVTETTGAAPPGPTETPEGVNWLPVLVTLIAIAVLSLAVVFLLRRKRPPEEKPPEPKPEEKPEEKPPEEEKKEEAAEEPRSEVPEEAPASPPPAEEPEEKKARDEFDELEEFLKKTGGD